MKINVSEIQIKYFKIAMLITSSILFLFMYSAITTHAMISGDNQWEYTVDANNDVTITKYKGDASSLTIPSYIDNKKVISIGVNAFIRYNQAQTQTVPNTTLTTLQISEGIQTIKTGAFGNCTSLTSVVTPSTLTSIGDTAFFNCSSLSSINFESNLQTIGERAFFGTGFTSITIPASVTTMGLNPFTNCTNLNTLTVDSQNQNFTSVNNVLFNKSKTQLLIYPNGKTETSYTVPHEVTTIGGNAFYKNLKLTTVSLPNNLQIIGINAFGDSKISSISLPDTVTEIQNGAFCKCSNLNSVELSKNLQSIDIWAFYACPLTTIDFPYHLKSIGEGAFQGIPGLATARFYGEKPSIGTDVFLGASSNFTLQYNKEYSSSWNGFTVSPFTVTEFTVAPLGISFKSPTVNIPSGCQRNLLVSLSPSWIPEENLTWISDNPSIATVDNNGWITTETLGSTLIHVSTANGITAQCLITVTPPSTSMYEGFIYETDSNNEICIVSYNGPSQVVEIPATINGMPVTSFGDRAFKNTSITSISIPASVTTIGTDALTAPTLQSIQVDTTNPLYASENGILYSKDFATLLQYPTGKFDSEIYISPLVKNIHSYAFANTTNLNKITLPNGLTEIAKGTFSNCPNLSTIIIPPSVTMIRAEAFAGCTSLSSVEFSYYVRNIGERIFEGCTSLQTVKFIGAMPTMGSNIFSNVGTGFKIQYNEKYSSTWNSGYESNQLEPVTIGADSIELLDNYQNSVSEVYMMTSESKQLTAIVTPVWTTDSTVTWSSSNTSVATVSSDGLIQGKSGGTTTITASTTNGKTASCNVTVAVSASSIELNKTALTLNLGDTTTLIGTVYPTNAVNNYLFWSSSNYEVVSVMNTGMNTAQLEAIGIGTATITVSTSNNLSKTCTVTVVPKTLPPSAVSGLNVSNVSDKSISLTWSPSTGATGYKIYRSLNPTTGFTMIDTSQVTSYINDGLTSGVTYYYKIVSYNAGGDSVASSIIGQKTKPSVVSSLKATNVSSNSITLAWPVSAGATGYKIYRSLSPTTGFELITTTQGTSYINSTLKPGTTYYYKVIAINTAGDTTSSAIILQKTKPSAVSRLKVSSFSKTSIKLNWTRAAGATGYKIYRSIRSKNKFTLISTTHNTSYTNKKLKPGTTYYYKVIAYNSAGNATSSVIISKKTKK